MTESANNKQTKNKTLPKLGGGDSSSSDSEMISMQGSSLPAVSLPLGSTWQQRSPHLVLYLSAVLRSPSLSCRRPPPKSVRGFPNRSFPPAGSVSTCRACRPRALLARGGWLVCWLVGVSWAVPGFAGVCGEGVGGVTSPGLMTHRHSRTFTWPPRLAASSVTPSSPPPPPSLCMPY